jgi:hypothetical protein
MRAVVYRHFSLPQSSSASRFTAGAAGLLRARCERPRNRRCGRRAAEQRDEIATVQLIELHHKCRQSEARRSNL